MKEKSVLQMFIKGKLSTVSMTKERGCQGPYMKRKRRTKAEHTKKHMKHSMEGKGCMPEGRNIRERLAQWGTQLGKATWWMPEARVGRRAILVWRR
jgi:hypothetical protein